VVQQLVQLFPVPHPDLHSLARSEQLVCQLAAATILQFTKSAQLRAAGQHFQKVVAPTLRPSWSVSFQVELPVAVMRRCTVMVRP
jgi:hypothetical protein